MIEILFIYTIAALGFVYIVGHSVASKAIREWLYDRVPVLVALLECPACLGFWIGLVSGLLGIVPLHPLLLALYTSGAMLALGRATRIMAP